MRCMCNSLVQLPGATPWCNSLVQLPGATRAGLGMILIPDPDYIELPSLICQNQLVLMPVLLQSMQKLLVLLRLALALVLMRLRLLLIRLHLLWFFLVSVSCSLSEVLQVVLFVLFLLAFC